MEMHHKIVFENEKNRILFSAERSQIRANYGRSIMVDLGLNTPLRAGDLYHGTAQKFTRLIERNGLKTRSQASVHLSENVGQAR